MYCWRCIFKVGRFLKVGWLDQKISVCVHTHRVLLHIVKFSTRRVLQVCILTDNMWVPVHQEDILLHYKILPNKWNFKIIYLRVIFIFFFFFSVCKFLLGSFSYFVVRLLTLFFFFFFSFKRPICIRIKDHNSLCVIQWCYEPCHAGPPNKDVS